MFVAYNVSQKYSLRYFIRRGWSIQTELDCQPLGPSDCVWLIPGSFGE